MPWIGHYDREPDIDTFRDAIRPADVGGGAVLAEQD